VVVDSGNHRLAFWRLRDGTVWRHIGSFGNEPGQFIFPCAIASTSSGALVVTDQHRVQVLCVLDPTDVASVGRLSRFLPVVAVCHGRRHGHGLSHGLAHKLVRLPILLPPSAQANYHKQ
jgi:hypothetical protein